jgi:pyruvate kinase
MTSLNSDAPAPTVSTRKLSVAPSGLLGLVATLGPACKGREAELAAAGATQFRINASHLSASGLQKYIQGARRQAPEVAIVVDLQGAKMRLGDFEPRAVLRTEVLRLVLAQTPVGTEVPLPHPEAFRSLCPGDQISIDDGRIRATVLEVAAEHIVCEVQNDGLIRPRKGFNRAEHPVMLDDVTPQDLILAQAAVEAGCSSFALSFVADGRECDWLRRHLGGVQVAAKIERRDALAQLSQIARVADSLWICRGDLGAQLGAHALGLAVASVHPHELGAEVWMAGQVFEHLTAHRDTTRSEICHLYDLVSRGYAGIVLSDETAIGIDPVNAVRSARALLNASRSDASAG